MKGFLLTGSGVVPRDWIDKNGHVNVARYMALFDHGSDMILGQLGIQSDLTMVASRIYIEHKKELFEGENWNLWTGVVTLQYSFLTITHRLMSGESLRAKCDLRSVFFSKSARSSVSLCEEVIANARKFIVAGLADRFQ